MFLKRKNVVKTVILELFFVILELIFRQSWSLSLRVSGFSFFIGFNARHAFNMRFHVSQKRIAIFLLPIFDKLQFLVSICQKASQGTCTISCFWTNFFTKIQSSKPGQRQTVKDVMRTQRLREVGYHRRYLVLFSILYPLFNKIQRNFNVTVR